MCEPSGDTATTWRVDSRGLNVMPAGSVMAKRATGRATAGLIVHATEPASAAATTAAPIGSNSRRHNATRGRGAGTASIAGAVSDSSISNRASAMSASRRRRSRSSDRRSNRRMAGGVAAGNASQSGSPRKTAANVSDTSSPSKARLPVSVSYRTQPKAHTSLRLSASLPLACSGLM
jgi:hypothetical protein